MDLSAGGTTDILQRITDPLLVLNREGRCQFINAAAMALFGGQSGGNASPHTLTLWPLPVFLADSCRQAAASQTVTNCEWNDGQGKWTEFRIFPSETGFTIVLQDITARKHAEEAQIRTANRLDLIARIARNVVASLPLTDQMHTTAEQVRDAFGADACVVRSLEGERLILLGSAGLPESALFPSLHAGVGMAKDIIESQSPYAIPDIEAHPALEKLRRVPGGYRYRAYAGAPLIAEGNVVGILGIYMEHAPRVFTEAELEHLQIVAHYAAVSLVNHRLYRALEERVIEREAAEARARASETRFQAIFEHSLDAIGVLSNGRHVYGNPAYRRLFGLGDAIADTPIRQLIAPHAKGRIQRHLSEHLQRTKGTRGGLVFESVGQRTDGTTFPIEVHGSTYAHDRQTYTILIVRDITERKQIEAEREKALSDALDRAERDPLTGLYNHHAFHKRLTAQAQSLENGGLPFTLVLMDMNNFKFFNEAYGHAAGDKVLMAVADAMRSFCGRSDIAARLGGDEFALLLPGVYDVVKLMPHLQQSVLKIGYRPAGHAVEIPIGLSAGIVCLPHETRQLSEAIHLADERMRRSKYGTVDAIAETTRETFAHRVEGFSMLDALVVAVDNKDRYTRRHSEEVMRYALWIAREMGLSEDDQALLKMAALLHDVGKIGVPDAILRQPAPLTSADYDVMKQHASLGALLVAAVPGMEAIVPAIRSHHEAVDGSGYPDGLRGEDIPLFARILAVADTYSAMTTDRPYRKALSCEVAQVVIASGAGRQWDASCVAAFLRAISVPRHRDKGIDSIK